MRDWLDAPDGTTNCRRLLPADVVDGTAARYREAYATGRPFETYLRSAGVDDAAAADAAALGRLREEHA